VQRRPPGRPHVDIEALIQDHPDDTPVAISAGQVQGRVLVNGPAVGSEGAQELGMALQEGANRIHPEMNKWRRFVRRLPGMK